VWCSMAMRPRLHRLDWQHFRMCDRMYADRGGRCTDCCRLLDTVLEVELAKEGRRWEATRQWRPRVTGNDCE